MLRPSAAYLGDDRGRAIYQQQCAECHGSDGQGVSGEYETALGGEQTLQQLTQLIAETMPEQDPSKCVGGDALAVARYIHKTFYATGATAPAARIELQRLTSVQMREAIADSLGELTWRIDVAEVAAGTHGLTGKYFNARNQNQKMFAAERIDSQINFDFGKQTPTRDLMPAADANSAADSAQPEKEEGAENIPRDEEFSIHWNGGILAPRTGEYELIVHSSNGFRLYCNDLQTPLIDHWVTAGRHEHRQRVFLLGGRVYPIRLSFFKYKDADASLQLGWKPPGEAASVIDADYLIPDWVPPVGVVQTSFPPDDASAGYERGTQVSAQWERATTAAAIEAAEMAVRLLNVPRDESGLNNKQKQNIHQRLRRMVTRALGRELDGDERQRYLDQFLDNEELSYADRIKRVVLLTLKSPKFLFPRANPKPAGYRLAERISWYLTDSLPDRQLWEAAGANPEGDLAQLAGHAQRLAQSPAGRRKTLEFFRYWLEIDTETELQKDADAHPGFDEHLASQLRSSLERMVAEIVESDASDYRRLFQDQELLATRTMSEYYDLPSAGNSGDGLTPESVLTGNKPIALPEAEDFYRTGSDSAYRAGVLTHPYLLSQFAYFRNSSPIHRGVFIVRQLLGRSLNPPPDAVEPLSESFDPQMTTRQRVEYQTKPVACMNCHALINPLGFNLENFDATGRYRDSEKGQPIDSTVELPEPLLQISGQPDEAAPSATMESPRQLADWIVQDTRAQRHFVRLLFQFVTKQPVEAYGESLLDELHQDFVRQDYNMRKLIVRIALAAARRDLEWDEHSIR